MNLYIIGIYLLTMSICIRVLDLIYFIPFFIVTLAFTFITLNLEKRERVLYLIIASIFLVHGVTGVNFTNHKIGDRIEVVAQSEARSSLIKKIDGKLLKENLFLDEGSGRSGKYIIIGDILEKNISRGKTTYKLDVFFKERIENSLIRRYIDSRIEIMMKGYSSGLKNFYRGIIVGEKKDLDRELLDKFSYTGTSHLIVISGLHIGVIIALLMYIAAKLPVSHDIRHLVVIIVLSLYTLAVGSTPSVIRAYIMGMCYLCGGLFYEESEGRRSLFVAMIINLIIDPLGAGRISFQLSYIAVFVILFIYPYYEKNVKIIESRALRWILTMGGLSLAIQLALIPIFMMNFRSIPLLSFLVNIVAIPIGVLLVQTSFLALLLSFIGLGSLLMPTVNLIYHLLIGFIGWASALPLLSVEYRGVTREWYPLLIYLAIFLFSKGKTRTLSLVPVIALILFNRERESIYIGDGYTYYHPRIIVAEKVLSIWDIDEIWNNGIKRHSVMISSKKQDEEVMKRLGISESVILKEEEKAKVGKYKFINIDNVIIKE